MVTQASWYHMIKTIKNNCKYLYLYKQFIKLNILLKWHLKYFKNVKICNCYVF